jgi:uncharacterized protein YgiM (DUF1202 family)
MADIDTGGDKNFTFLAMKTNGWMTLSVALLAFTLGARADGQLEPTAAPAKPAAKPAVVAKSTTASAEAPAIFSPGAAKAVGKNINVRGRAGFIGEVVGKLQDGETVTVIEQVILSKPKAGEPAQWVKIGYPAGAHVWVHSSYLNADNTVKPRRLNVRTGAGENFSIVGTLDQNTPVKVVSTKGNWTQIEAPAGAFAFVAARFLQQEPTTVTPEGMEPVAPVVTIQPPDAEPTTVAGGPDITPVPTDVAGEPTPVVIEDVATAGAPPPVVEEVWVPRSVAHEGIVRATISVQAPTRYGLYSKENSKLINFLYSPTPQLDLSKYFNRQVIITGQEGLEERWKNTPVLTIQKIYVVE